METRLPRKRKKRLKKISKEIRDMYYKSLELEHIQELRELGILKKDW